jgi:hypothetical protein
VLVFIETTDTAAVEITQLAGIPHRLEQRASIDAPANGIADIAPEGADIAASAKGHEHSLLCLGSLPKNVMHRIRSGERPVAITERDKPGTEFRAAIGTPSAVACVVMSSNENNFQGTASWALIFEQSKEPCRAVASAMS